MPNSPKKINRAYKTNNDRKPFGRRRDLSWFYNQRKWRKTAFKYKQKHPLCVACDAKGIVSPAEVTDHIKGLSYLLDNSKNPYDFDELQSLCHPCHNAKSGRDAHK